MDSGVTLKDLVPIYAENENWRLDGFICNHGFSNATKQFVFVNKRWVRRSRMIQVISKACKVKSEEEKTRHFLGFIAHQISILVAKCIKQGQSKMFKPSI